MDNIYVELQCIFSGVCMVRRRDQDVLIFDTTFICKILLKHLRFVFKTHARGRKNFDLAHNI